MRGGERYKLKEYRSVQFRCLAVIRTMCVSNMSQSELINTRTHRLTLFLELIVQNISGVPEMPNVPYGVMELHFMETTFSHNCCVKFTFNLLDNWAVMLTIKQRFCNSCSWLRVRLWGALYPCWSSALECLLRAPFRLKVGTGGSQQKLTDNFTLCSIHKLKLDVYH